MEKYVFGFLVQRYRKACGLTQKELAAKLGVSVPTVTRWETRICFPKFVQLCELAAALGVPVAALVDTETDVA